MPDIKDLADRLDITKSLLSKVNQNSDNPTMSSSTKSFSEELKILSERLSMLNEKVENSFESKKSHELRSILEEIIQLKNELVESSCFDQLNKSNGLKLDFTEDLSLEMITELQTNANEDTKIDDQKKNYSEGNDKQCNKIKRSVEINNQAIDDKINNTQEEKKQLNIETRDNFKQLNELMQQTKGFGQAAYNRLEEQKHKITEAVEEEIRQTEQNIINHERNIQTVVFTRIYEKHFEKEIQDVSNFNLKINLTKQKYKLLMRDCVTSRLRLPDLNEVEIKYISDADEDLVSFLSDCTPAHLKLLVVNWCSKNSNGIKSRFYIDVLSKAAAKTSKLVFLTCIDFSAEDLQTVVKSSCNAERIVFCFCSIHCSSSLDFKADLSYNTKLLSFQGCGCTSFIERTTDWKEDPSCFSLIVDAIGSSGLRASLQKLSIAANQTLSKSKVQEELNSKGMPHISVVEEYIGPHSS